jgi:hypothetical protein
MVSARLFHQTYGTRVLAVGQNFQKYFELVVVSETPRPLFRIETVYNASVTAAIDPNDATHATSHGSRSQRGVHMVC